MLVEAHSGALAGNDAAWEALFAAYGVHRADGMDTFVDSLEAFSIGRRVAASSSFTSMGIATVHDSGAERVLVADVAEQVGVGFADISRQTRAHLAQLLGPGLQPVNPLDVWSTGADTAELFTACMAALSDDEAVALVALAVDLVSEYDGDDAYPAAVEAMLRHTEKPVVVLSNLAAAVDQKLAARLRAQGVPVLEGTRSGLRTLSHLLACRPHLPVPAAVEAERRDRWRHLLARGRPDHATSLRLLAEYGLRTAAASPVGSSREAVDAAAAVGYPVVLKTDDPAISHKAAVGGVKLRLHDPESVAAAYGDLASRLGPRVTVQHEVPAGAELYVGLLRDPLLGPLVVVAAGGTLVGLLGARRVALPPLDEVAVRAMLGEPSMARLLDGSDLRGVVAAVLGISQIAAELGDVVDALDVNPLIVTADGAVAVDALVVPVNAPGSDAS